MFRKFEENRRFFSSWISPTKIFVYSNEIIFHPRIYFWRWTVHSYDRKNTKWDILGIFLFSMKIISQAIKCFGFNGHWNQVFWKQQQVSWKTSVKKQQNADFIFMCFATKAPPQISVVAKHSSYNRVYTVAWAVTGTCTRSRSFNSKCRATDSVISWLEILNKFTIENP